MRWSYGVVSVASRLHTLLPQTLASLAAAGFDKPRVFIDNAHGDDPRYVFRGPRINEYGNWLLALVELHVRDPNAERYAIFQDDIVMYPGCREYLERTPFPAQGYWNLFTFMENEDVVRGQPDGWYEAAVLDESTNRQSGRGALGLVFDDAGMLSLLSHRNTWARVRHPIGCYNTDGAVVAALNSVGYREYIHNPSLVQHVGYPTTVLRMDEHGKPFEMDLPQSAVWRGDGFDASGISVESHPTTVDDVLGRLPLPRPGRLEAPPFRCSNRDFKLGFCVPSMRHHVTNEGWEIFQGLKQGGGYELVGYADDPEVAGLATTNTNVGVIIECANPSIVVMQDRREYDGGTTQDNEGVRGPFDERERFTNVSALKSRVDVFKVTILKDAHQRPEYHREAAEEIDAHAWVVYYHPRIVAALAPFVRPEHLIRTYHSIDPARVPAFNEGERNTALLSGAVSRFYPIRVKLTYAKMRGELPTIDCLSHPGYHANGAETPEYLKLLSGYKVAICTSSIFGYSLRKIVEATACGCVVVTDLPIDDVLPEIDGNLVRVNPKDTVRTIERLVEKLAAEYDVEKQRDFAEKAVAFYDYRETGRRLAEDIEKMRAAYPCTR